VIEFQAAREQAARAASCRSAHQIQAGIGVSKPASGRVYHMMMESSRLGKHPTDQGLRTDELTNFEGRHLPLRAVVVPAGSIGVLAGFGIAFVAG
jgi:hypothetical protein